MRSWAMVLHFYQPPTQELGITQEILNVCYQPLVDLLLGCPRVKLTLNLTGSLLLQLEKIGSSQFFEGINKLLDNNQIELLNSPVNHPLLPLVDSHVLRRQFEINKYLLKRLFPKALVSGAFLPELAGDKRVLEEIEKISHYSIIDQTAVVGEVDLLKIPKNTALNVGNFKLLVSSRLLTELIRAYPQRLESKGFIDLLEKQTGQNETVVSVNDAEIFGHHYQERIHFLKEIFQDPEINFVTASEILGLATKRTVGFSDLRSTTWQTSLVELKNNNTFPLWLNPINELQKAYYAFSCFVQEIICNADRGSPLYHYAQEHCDRGVSSCHLYWLSNWPWWNPDLVQLGASELVRAIRTLPEKVEIKNQAEKMYHELVHNIWQRHWSGEIEKQYVNYAESYKVFLQTLPKI